MRRILQVEHHCPGIQSNSFYILAYAWDSWLDYFDKAGIKIEDRVEIRGRACTDIEKKLYAWETLFISILIIVSIGVMSLVILLKLFGER
jgi:hypothetical protein